MTMNMNAQDRIIFLLAMRSTVLSGHQTHVRAKVKPPETKGVDKTPIVCR